MRRRVIPRISRECLLAQDAIARRIPCSEFGATFVETLRKENRELLFWIKYSIREIVDSENMAGEEFDHMRELLLAHYGMFYGAIKSQIEGQVLDDNYGVIDQISCPEAEAPEGWEEGFDPDEDLASGDDK